TRSSVESPMADTTTTTEWPRRFVSTTRRATFFSISTVATEEPPYFCTMMFETMPFPLTCSFLRALGASCARPPPLAQIYFQDQASAVGRVELSNSTDKNIFNREIAIERSATC